MKTPARFLTPSACLLWWLGVTDASFDEAAAASTSFEPRAIVQPSQASPAEALAAREVRRYVYLRTGRFLPMWRISGATLLNIPWQILHLFCSQTEAVGAPEKLERLGDRQSVCAHASLTPELL